MPITPLTEEDFVNGAKEKVNNAFKEIPISFVPTPDGNLTITKFSGEKITVPLKNFFALLSTVFDSIRVGMATPEEAGKVFLVDDDIPAHFQSSNRILTAVQVADAIQAAIDAVTPAKTLTELINAASTAQRSSALLSLLNAADDDAKAKFCSMVSSCGVVIGNPTVTSVILEHFEEIESVVILPYNYRGGFDTNDCDKITCWLADKNRPNEIPVVGMRCDGFVVDWVTAQVVRVDVKTALTTDGIAGVTNTVFGVEWFKPARFRDGLAHTWDIVGEHDGLLQVDYNKPKIVTCAAPVDNTPYVAQYLVSPSAIAITKGGATITASIIERLSNDTRRAYTGNAVPVFSAEGAPAGITITPNSDKTVTITASNAAAITSLQLNATIGATSAIPATVQVLTGACQRPSGLTTFIAAWNFAPTGGNAREFSSLDDANNTAGQKFDNTTPGNLATYQFQVANLAIGETAYYETLTDCTKVGTGIGYVLDTSSGNTVRKAVQFNNGVIIDLKGSSYTTPSTITSLTIDETPLQEGSSAVAHVIAHYADGSSAQYEGPGVFEYTGNYPPSMSLSYGNTGVALIALGANTISADQTVVLRFTPTGGAPVTGNVLLKNVNNAATNVIDRMTIFHPVGWHTILPSSHTVSENLVLLVNVNGPGGAALAVQARYTGSRNDSTFGVMQKLDYSQNSGDNPLPAGYSHFTYFNDELFSNSFKTFQAKLPSVANSQVQSTYLANASAPDHTTAQIYPVSN
ncbi:hypothetical protein [Spirosoma flavum]|uniref:Uncharacterized protein n=1 Tax=Spirosoma flavum TaxID=2048557 RepID=A0ABW6AQ97_9BACT